jgi:hypothetical protein
VTQEIKHLLSKHEAQSSNPNTTKKGWGYKALFSGHTLEDSQLFVCPLHTRPAYMDKYSSPLLKDFLHKRTDGGLKGS